MYVKRHKRRKCTTEELDQVKIKQPEEKRPHPPSPEASAAWDAGPRSATFFKKVKDEKEQQLHGEEAVKDHL